MWLGHQQFEQSHWFNGTVLRYLTQELVADKSLQSVHSLVVLRHLSHVLHTREEEVLDSEVFVTEFMFIAQKGDDGSTAAEYAAVISNN